jgi:membrane protein DedA with SNARE-associated domain
MAYAIGHRWSGAFARRAQRKPRFEAKLAWARGQIKERGGLLLITARFIPGGRTALTLASGITRQPRMWFVRWTFVAALIWATYAAGLARLVGEPFRDDHTKAFWVAFATALSINVVIEVARHFRAKRKWSKAAT